MFDYWENWFLEKLFTYVLSIEIRFGDHYKMRIISKTKKGARCWWLLKIVLFIFVAFLKTKALKHHHNELYSQISKIEMLRNDFQVVSKDLKETLVLTKGSFFFNIATVFPGVPQKEIQQWRQARSPPGQKETLNVMLMVSKWPWPCNTIEYHDRVNSLAAAVT